MQLRIDLITNFEENCKQQIVVKCKATGCDFFICVRGNVKFEGMVVKKFKGQHKHSVGDECQVGKKASESAVAGEVN